MRATFSVLLWLQYAVHLLLVIDDLCTHLIGVFQKQHDCIIVIWVFFCLVCNLWTLLMLLSKICLYHWWFEFNHLDSCFWLQAIPGMLLALVLFFDNRKFKDVNVPSDVSPPRRRNYVWYALTGYGIGLVAALAAGILSQSPQPALLYLVSVVMLYSQVLDHDCCLFILLNYASLTWSRVSHSIESWYSVVSSYGVMLIAWLLLTLTKFVVFRCHRHWGLSCTCHGYGMSCGSYGKGLGRF